MYKKLLVDNIKYVIYIYFIYNLIMNDGKEKVTRQNSRKCENFRA